MRPQSCAIARRRPISKSAARQFELRGILMPELVPQTQTGSLTDDQIGTNDTFIGFTFLLGDAGEMHDDSQGGNDTLIGADYSPQNYLWGDASLMDDHSRGGNDTLVGGAYSTDNFLYGDASAMGGNAIGGND